MVDLLTHLRSHLGESSHEVLRAGPVSVRAWPDPDGDVDVRVLVTLGMSALPHASPPPGRCVVADPRVELLLLCPVAYESEFARLLVDLAGYPESENTWLHWFHNLALGGPFLSGSALTAAFTDVPFLGAAFSTFEHLGLRIDLLWVVPITAAEHQCLLANGFDVFTEVFEAAEPCITDPFRASTIVAGAV